MPKKVGPNFPIIITSFEMAMFDAKLLANYQWKYVVVDEVMEFHLLRIFVLVCFSPVPMYLHVSLIFLFPGASVEKYEL